MPIVSDLDTAMLQPARSVPAVRHLGGGTIRMDDSGRPLRTIGRDAVVYELRTPSGRIVALRCLLRADSKRDIALAARYAALGGDPQLEPLRGPAGPLPRGIRWIADAVVVPGPDFHAATASMAVMERVPGRTLARTVDRLCRERQTEPLALLADGWLATATALEDGGFVHGDLAADNLIVRPDGTIGLIDLDTASWPSSPVPPLVSGGTPGYAHPRGVANDPARRDHFPALVLWASLCILTRHPGLRERWGDSPETPGAVLLWSTDDLRRPARSPLFAALDALDDAQLAPVIEVVRRAIRFSPDDTPPLAEIAERLAGHDDSREAMTTIAPLASDDDEWGSGDTSPPPRPGTRDGRAPDASRTTTLVERERRRGAARQIAAAVAARDTAAAVRLWEESRTIPEVATYAASVHLLVSHDATASIERATRHKDDEGLVAAVAQAELLGVAPTPEARGALRAARERIAARSALRDAIERRDFHALAALSVAGNLICLGRLDPAVARAVERGRAWPALERALRGNDDIAIAATADPALWREEGAMPPAARTRLDLA
nr:phosphotransferase [Chloroflexia bacterium]